MNGGIIKNIILKASRYGFLIFALMALLLLRVAGNFLSNNVTYDVVVELLLGLVVIVLVVKSNGVTAIKSTKIKSFVNLIARYSFTLYLVHAVIAYLLFEINIAYHFNLHPLALSAAYIIIANVIALAVAYPTEMRYKKLTKILNEAIYKLSLFKGVRVISPSK
jgi:peptidoglycan/LPS O-acetylase OafA/YrhL